MFGWKPKPRAKPSLSDTVGAVITRRELETDDVVSLEIAAADGGALPPFDAGSHIEIDVGPNLIRHYSLSNNPSETHRYVLAVLLDPTSRGGSAEIHRSFKVGQKLRLKPPRNNFPLVEAARRSVLLAGGIGITPILAMAHRLTDQQADFELHYSARSRSRAAFLGLLAEPPFRDRVRLHFDDEEASQRLDLNAIIGTPDQDTHLYICGPTGFMNFTVYWAKAAGWPLDNIHVEYFTGTVDVTGNNFTVRAARSGISCEVPNGKSIADVLVAKGIEVPMSCEEGVCGTCLTKVLEGEPDHRDIYQTKQEKAANTYITICCSRSKSRLLVLDL